MHPGSLLHSGITAILIPGVEKSSQVVRGARGAAGWPLPIPKGDLWGFVGVALDCYWVGSLHFNFFGKSRAFPLNPQKVKLFAEGSTATKLSHAGFL